MSAPECPSPLRSDQICCHDDGFTLHTFKDRVPIPGAWFCSVDCGFWLNFDPMFAGAVRPRVYKDMPWFIYNQKHWTSFVVSYTFEPVKATKVWKASKTSPG